MKLSELMIALEEGKLIAKILGGTRIFYRMVKLENGRRAVVRWSSVTDIEADERFIIDLSGEYEIVEEK